ncbi:hypothetical protein [Longimicrobium sp.]|uniref:hypothetical protein n=1 Tax=Longimicrobium sp. TaxID=2029185 RepID=UPI002C3770D9|nr:hypothetical protein [Longimicrobium sp.]HSU15026.1 hypothetical protein [Longimicrobium sp.]
MNPVDRFVLAHRARIDRLLLAAAVALPLLALAVAGCIAMRLIDFGARSGAAVTFLVIYVAPLVLAVPLWFRGRLEVPWRVRVLDLTVTALAFVRFAVRNVLPFSGHMLFLTYSALSPPVGRRYRLLAIALLVETTVLKLWIWRDSRSWLPGLIAGLAAAAIGRVIAGRPKPPSPAS